MLYQQKLQAQQFHQQRMQRQNTWQPAQFGAPPTTALVLPQIRASGVIQQPMNRFPLPTLQIHRQPPPGFGCGVHSQQGIFLKWSIHRVHPL